MTVRKRRVDKVAASLTAKEAVLLWLTERMKAGSWKDAAMQGVKEGVESLPRVRVNHAVAKATRDSMKGQDREAIERAVHLSCRDADFLVMLVIEANKAILSNSRADTLQACLLAEQIKGILELDSVSNEMRRIWTFLMETAYPLDQDTAAAIDAVNRYQVDAKDTIEEATGDWILSYFVDQGKTALPAHAYEPFREPGDDRPDSWRRFHRPDDVELLNIFDDVDRFNAFAAGQDYQHGLADVRDAEFAEVEAAFDDAFNDLIDSGQVRMGTFVELTGMVNDAFLSCPLIEGEWIDRYVIELNEWGALLKERGFRSNKPDPHLLAWHRFYRPKDESGREMEVADAEQIDTIREEAKRNMTTFTGRKTTIDGREYWSFDDFAAWPDRKWKGDRTFELAVASGTPEHFEGIDVPSWNAWIDANGGDGVAELAGIKVHKIERLCGPGDFVAVDPADAAERQKRRFALLDRIDSWMATKTSIEGEDYVQSRMQDAIFERVARFSLVGYQTRIADWRVRAMAHAGEVFRIEAAIQEVQKKYFDGHPILFPDVADMLKDQVRLLNEVIDLFNGTVAFRLQAFQGQELLTGEKPQDDQDIPEPIRPGFKIDLDEVRRLVRPHVRAKVNDLIEAAKAETLDAFEGTEASLRFIADGAEGDPKP